MPSDAEPSRFRLSYGIAGAIGVPRRAAPSPGRRPAGGPSRLRAACGGFWPKLLPVLLVLTALTRLPSFGRPLWNPDEGFLATQARMMAGGATLYDTVVDRKPPLLPWLYQASFTVFGDTTLLPLKVAAVLAVVAAAALVAAIARRRWGERAGWTGGVSYVLVSIGLNPADSQSAAFELFMVPFTVAAMWCADRGRWGRAGLAVAGAVLVKQTGGAVLLPVLFLLWRGEPRGGRRGPLVRLGLGFLVPVAAVALYCGPLRFLFWTVTGSGSYASVTGSELYVLGRALLNTAIVATACAGLLIPLVRVVRRRARLGVPGTSRAAPGADLWVWLGASAIAVVTGFHFFGHYFLQLLPVVVLLGTGALQLLPPQWLRNSLLCSLLICGLFLGWGAAAGSPELDHARRVADTVRKHSGPDEAVLVWGMHPEVYWLANRTPASRYLTAGFLTNYSGGRNGPQVGQRYAMDGTWRVFTDELRARPPRVIVDDSRGKPYRPARVPALQNILSARYERAAVVDGAVIYRLAD